MPVSRHSCDRFWYWTIVARPQLSDLIRIWAFSLASDRTTEILFAMSMKRTVILTAVANSNHIRSNKTDNRMVKRNDTNYDNGLAVNMNDNVNVVLAG